MSWFNRPKTDPRDALIEVLRDEVAVLRKLHTRDTERMDRLMEALATKAGVPLVMPIEPVPPQPPIHIPNPWKDPNPITPIKEKVS